MGPLPMFSWFTGQGLPSDTWRDISWTKDVMRAGHSAVLAW